MAATLDLRGADAPARLVERIRALSADLDGNLDRTADDGLAADASLGRSTLVTRGYARTSPLAPATSCARLVTIIERLVDAGLPAVCAFVTDLAVSLAPALERVVSTYLGEAYAVIDDAWAWRIPQGASGWAPHRGTETPLVRERPELVNAWVALTDVTENRSCMHFVALDDDVHYPDALARVDFASSVTRAESLEAGEALVWNANVLHWGGPCAVDAIGPRVSCALSLMRGIEHRPRTPLARRTPLERVDLVAAQVATYGEGQPDVSAEFLDWARATCALKAHLDVFPRKER
jgi:hypothetical protein